MKNILIVDNDEAVCEYEKNILELSGYSAEYVCDGTSACDMIKKGGYDLFILSIMLPGVDGFELLRRIRLSRATPVVMVTVRTAESDIIRAFSMGADDYMTKPVSPGEFLARIGAAFARIDRATAGSGYGGDRIIEIGGRLRIDRLDMRVWIDGEEKDLTAREFDLLMYMVDHPNEVISKEDLCRVLWTDDDFVSNSTLPVHMLHLRKKLFDSDQMARHIETIWGKGYRFRT